MNITNTKSHLNVCDTWGHNDWNPIIILLTFDIIRARNVIKSFTLRKIIQTHVYVHTMCAAIYSFHEKSTKCTFVYGRWHIHNMNTWIVLDFVKDPEVEMNIFLFTIHEMQFKFWEFLFSCSFLTRFFLVSTGNRSMCVYFLSCISLVIIYWKPHQTNEVL